MWYLLIYIIGVEAAMWITTNPKLNILLPSKNGVRFAWTMLSWIYVFYFILHFIYNNLGKISQKLIDNIRNAIKDDKYRKK